MINIFITEDGGAEFYSLVYGEGEMRLSFEKDIPEARGTRPVKLGTLEEV